MARLIEGGADPLFIARRLCILASEDVGLADPQARNALGICATQAAGLRAATGTDAGALQAGKAAFNAVEAAQLASLGFTSSREPLNGRRGLFTLFGTPAP